MSLASLIGKTPLVEVDSKFVKNSNRIFVKLEQFNFGGSIKSRIALQMVLDAEEEGILRPFSNQTIVEPTGGNTGIGLAVMGILRGYKTILVVPDNYSKIRIKILEYYGAKVQRSDSKTGNDSHIVAAKRILEENPDFIMLDQFNNPSNPLSHYKHTGSEILEVVQNIDYFIAGVGSGGTIMGVGRRLKESNENIHIIGVQPFGCDLRNNIFVPHKIQGIAIGYKSSFLDYSLIDDFISIKDTDAINFMAEASRQQGFSFGISSSSNVLAALMLSEQVKNKVIVTVAPDGLTNYMDII